MTIGNNRGRIGDQEVRRFRGRIPLLLATGALVLVVIALYGRDAGDEIRALETWIAGLGILGPIVFAGAVVVLTSVFVPSIPLSAVAGALFGLSWGTLAMSIGMIVGATLNYWVAQKLLRNRISDMVRRHPKLQAIQRAMQREGLRLQFMLRLAPVNAVSVSYVLGAAGAPFPPFVLASMGLIPVVFVEVYFGYVARHVSKTVADVSSPHTMDHVLTIGGFIVCVLLLIYVARMAEHALAEAEAEIRAES